MAVAATASPMTARKHGDEEGAAGQRRIEPMLMSG